MVGLVSVDLLTLTPLQWLALGLNAMGWLWCVRHSERWAVTAALTFAGVWTAFWNETTSVDMWLLFREAATLSPSPWPTVLEDIVHGWYLNLQPPLFTYWLSRVPVLWFQQLVWCPFGLLCAGLMWALYGRAAALLLATPVFALMIHQPCHDTLLFGLLLIVLRLIQMGQRALAAFVYGLSWPVKPLTILTAPFILPQLGWFGLGSLAMWGGYLCWSLQWTFGQHQARFLLHQLMLRLMKPSAGVGKRAASSLSLFTQVHAVARKILGTLGWRWEHLGHKALAALPFYLFPAWLRPWSRQGLVLCAIILLGYGNIKYLLLDLLFLFPVQEDVPNMTHQ